MKRVGDRDLEKIKSLRRGYSRGGYAIETAGKCWARRPMKRTLHKINRAQDSNLNLSLAWEKAYGYSAGIHPAQTLYEQANIQYALWGRSYQRGGWALAETQCHFRPVD
jgi:hypothetical protein